MAQVNSTHGQTVQGNASTASTSETAYILCKYISNMTVLRTCTLIILGVAKLDGPRDDMQDWEIRERVEADLRARLSRSAEFLE